MFEKGVIVVASLPPPAQEFHQRIRSREREGGGGSPHWLVLALDPALGVQVLLALHTPPGEQKPGLRALKPPCGSLSV